MTPRIRFPRRFTTSNADSSDAWLGTPQGRQDSWSRAVIGAATATPPWAARLSNGPLTLAARKVERVPLDAPNVAFIRDTLINGARRVVLRVTAPHGATSLVMRASGAPVLTASIDGRTTPLSLSHAVMGHALRAVPDSGAIVALSIPSAQRSTSGLCLVFRIPAIPGHRAASAALRRSRPGCDVSVVYRSGLFDFVPWRVILRSAATATEGSSRAKAVRP
jgi:hypothetical protein